jgi:hypothetical protein
MELKKIVLNEEFTKLKIKNTLFYSLPLPQRPPFPPHTK